MIRYQQNCLVNNNRLVFPFKLSALNMYAKSMKCKITQADTHTKIYIDKDIPEEPIGCVFDDYQTNLLFFQFKLQFSGLKFH